MDDQAQDMSQGMEEQNAMVPPDTDGASDGGEEASEGQGQQNSDPLYVQKRLKQQKRAHEREIRELHSRMNEMHAMIQGQNQSQSSNQYAAPSGVDEQIHKAVGFALEHRDRQEQQAKHQQNMQYLAEKYKNLDKHLDSGSDKYDDFDDVVRGNSVPYTETMRDMALTLPAKGPGSAAEVLYRLGKNPDEFARVKKLHPLDQAAEMVRLSHALLAGEPNKAPAQSRDIGQIKSNPVRNNGGITEKTSISDIRQRMKSGLFK
jgi:uncharacterized protein YukE